MKTGLDAVLEQAIADRKIVGGALIVAYLARGQILRARAHRLAGPGAPTQNQ